MLTKRFARVAQRLERLIHIQEVPGSNPGTRIMKKTIIIHGYRSYPQDCWFPWIKKELNNRGVKVLIPQMPNPARPKKQSWVNKLKKVAGKIDENTVFVGHSLGVITILRFLETLERKQKIGGAISVAGRIVKRKTFHPLNHFFTPPLQWKKIKDRGKFVGIYSYDDPVVSLRDGKEFKKNLNAKLIIEKNKGHFSREDKVFKLPSLLKAISDILS